MRDGEPVPEDLVRVSGADDCRHPELSFVGGDKGGNEYYRCPECGAVLIRKGSVSRHELQAEIEAGGRDGEPNPFSELLDAGAGRPTSPTTPDATPSGRSLVDALRGALFDRLPFFEDDRDR